MRNYAKLAIEPFGRALIKSGDLDPIYVALAGLLFKKKFSVSQVCRWLVAYWCFYDAGVACFLSEKEEYDFWHWFQIAVKNETPDPQGNRWARGKERRHFRGQAAQDSTQYLMERYRNKPELMVKYIGDKAHKHEVLTFAEVSRRVQEHVGFGPWIGFKIADMLDRVLCIKIDFSNAELSMFKDPQKAAIMLWELREGVKYGAPLTPKIDNVLKGVNEYLKKAFQDLKAPPFLDRPIGVQETETVLCKWKSHMNGHYPLGNDIIEITHNVELWKSCESSYLFLSEMPKFENGKNYVD